MSYFAPFSAVPGRTLVAEFDVGFLVSQSNSGPFFELPPPCIRIFNKGRFFPPERVMRLGRAASCFPFSRLSCSATSTCRRVSFPRRDCLISSCFPSPLDFSFLPIYVLGGYLSLCITCLFWAFVRLKLSILSAILFGCDRWSCSLFAFRIGPPISPFPRRSKSSTASVCFIGVFCWPFFLLVAGKDA